MPIQLERDNRTIHLDGVIASDDVSAKEFRTGLKMLGPGPVTVRINSPGGDVFQAVAITQSMIEHDGTIETINDGLAASGGVDIFLAGDKRSSTQQSMFMVHRAWAVVFGNAADLMREAEVLGKVDAQRRAWYSDRVAGLDRKTLDLWFDGNDQWLDADEAFRAGLSTTAAQGKAKQAPSADEARQRVAAALRTGSESREWTDNDTYLQDIDLRLRMTRKGLNPRPPEKPQKPLTKAQIKRQHQDILNRLEAARRGCSVGDLRRVTLEEKARQQSRISEMREGLSADDRRAAERRVAETVSGFKSARQKDPSLTLSSWIAGRDERWNRSRELEDQRGW